MGAQRHPINLVDLPATAYAPKVQRRSDGSAVLMCESGNPKLGLILTPTGDGRLIATMPGDDGHPLSAVAITLGHAQVRVMGLLARDCVGSQ